MFKKREKRGKNAFLTTYGHFLIKLRGIGNLNTYFSKSGIEFWLKLIGLIGININSIYTVLELHTFAFFEKYSTFANYFL